MSKSRLGPEAKIISLFAALPDESKRIVLDVIKSQSATPRKPAANKPARQSAAAKEPATGKEATGGECGNQVGESSCGLPRENPAWAG